MDIFLLDSTCLITLYISFKCTGTGASMVLDSSLTGLQMSGLLCLVNTKVYPLHFCKSHVPQNSLCALDSQAFLL